jgi:cytochrome c556
MQNHRIKTLTTAPSHVTARALVAAVLACSVSLPALAGKAEDAVHYRQGILMGLAWNVGGMGAMIKGDVPFDAARFAFLAGRTAMLAPMVREGFTPDTRDVKSDARPALWDNLADLDRRFKALEAATARLAEISRGGDAGAMKVQFGETVQVCKGCHDEYRVKE